MRTSSVICLVLVAQFVNVSFCGLVRETFVCRPGVPYMQNQCNTCFCIAANDLVCTLLKCPQNKDKNLEGCATGRVWQEDCNKCWCTNAGTICTNHVCS